MEGSKQCYIRCDQTFLVHLCLYLRGTVATIVADRTSGFGGGLSAVTALWIHPNITATGALDFRGDGMAGSESENSAAVLRGVQAMLLASQLSNLAGRFHASSVGTKCFER